MSELDDLPEKISTVYTPSTRRVRAAYISQVCGLTRYEGKAEAIREQFNRWLFEIEENAWDRGYQAGVVDFAAEGTKNPYRQGENSE